jgi:uncharacterized protein YecE (DUF72 family)
VASRADRTDDEGGAEAVSSEQLSLFPMGSAATTSREVSGDRASLDARFEQLRPVAASLPPTLRMGTSSWSFPGWRGIVYPGTSTTSQLARGGLRDYARHPLLRTVGIDRTYYAPVANEEWERYAAQLPSDFVCCIKAPASITSYTVPGAGAPQPNPEFLSAERLLEELIVPCRRYFSGHTGPIILQFPPMSRRATLDPSAFAEMLDEFFERLPRDAEYAVEIRDRSLLTENYRRVVARNGAVHVCNYWSAMPMPGEQAALSDHTSAPFTMVRLLVRPGTRYEQQRQTMTPFNRLVQEDEHMRRDTVDVLRRAAAAGQRAFLLVNNKAEGSSPLTIEALARRLAAAV